MPRMRKWWAAGEQLEHGSAAASRGNKDLGRIVAAEIARIRRSASVSSLMAQAWWASVSTVPWDTTPDVAEMDRVWCKSSPLLGAVVHGIGDVHEYWGTAAHVISSVTGTDCPSAESNFPGFAKKVFDSLPALNPTTPEDVLKYMLVDPRIDDARYLIWQFSDALRSPFLFVSAFNLLLQQRCDTKLKVASKPANLDFIFDHYFPLLETWPIESNREAVIARISLIQMLCRMLMDYPDQIQRFKEFHATMWTRLLRIIERNSPTIAIAAFRMACQYWLKTMSRVSTQTQAAWMLKLIRATPAGSPLHFPAIYFAMQVRPKEFGFVTLCKTMIEGGVQDQMDIYMIGRILRLPVVKNPTDVILWLMKMACTDRLLAEAAVRTLARPLFKFRNVADLKAQAPLWIKRAVQFVALGSERGKYRRRVWNCVCLAEVCAGVDCKWIVETVTGAAGGVQGVGQATRLLAGKVPAGAVDPRVREELQVDRTRVDLKGYFNNIKVRLPMVDDEGGSSSRGGRSPRTGKPTVAEARAKWRASGSTVAPAASGLELLQDGAVPNDDDDDEIGQGEGGDEAGAPPE